MEPLELELAKWRPFVGRDPAVEGRDVEELEAQLRDQIADLNAAGLAADEAFLIAAKRLGSLDELSRELAREHSGRLWRLPVFGFWAVAVVVILRRPSASPERAVQSVGPNRAVPDFALPLDRRRLSGGEAP